jgi:hypothetical protein
MRGAEPPAGSGKLLYTPAPAAAGNFTYGGGPVITHVHVVVVFWGKNVASIATDNMANFYKAVTNSPFFDWLGEYDTVGHNPGTNQHIYHGVYDSSVTITPTMTSGTLQDSDIQTELANDIMSGALPMPKNDPAEGHEDTIYAIYFPPGIVINSGGTSCNSKGGSWCAYHGAVQIPGFNDGIAYSVIPDFSGSNNGCANGCGSAGTDATGAMTCTSAHELLEAITDTSNGWYDQAQGEIGDACATCDMVAGFWVQQCYSQRLQMCISTDPNLPLCDGKTRPCRSCTATDCSGATPVCVTDPLAPNSGLCVASGPTTDAGASSSSGGSGSSSGSSSGSTSGGSSGSTSGGSSGSSGSSSGSTSSTSGSSSGSTSGSGSTSSTSGSGTSSGGTSSGSGSGGGSGSGTSSTGSSGASSGSTSSASGSGSASGSSGSTGSSGAGSGSSGSGSGGSNGGGADAGLNDNGNLSQGGGCACSTGVGGRSSDLASGIGLLVGAAAFRRRARRTS